jgi:RNA polymerase sigma-70 factor, ECF subfamily
MTTSGARAETGDYVPLVRAAQCGDRDAYGELYLRFGRAVHAVLLARLPRTHVDDLVQDVFLHALSKLTDLREPAAFGGWICALARRRAVDHYRQLRATDPLTDSAAPGAAPDVIAEAAAAVAAIQDLPDAYRETLALRLIGGFSGPEIAGLTGLSPDSVRVNLHRGFRLLRERLGVTP